MAVAAVLQLELQWTLVHYARPLKWCTQCQDLNISNGNFLDIYTDKTIIQGTFLDTFKPILKAFNLNDYVAECPLVLNTTCLH